MQHRIAQSKIWRTFHRIGLADIIKSAYWSYKLPTTIDQTIAGIENEFVVSRSDDFFLVKKLSEEKVLTDFLRNLRNDDVIYDIGANVGLFTCYAASVASEGRVVAFEPHEENATALKANVKHQDAANVEVMQLALSDEKGTTELASSGSSREFALSADGEIEVQMARAESIAEEIGSPDVVKIDVEGAELNVLRGMESLLNSVRVVFCEVHPEKLRKFGSNSAQVEQFLKNRGFDIEKVDERESVYHLRAFSGN